MPRTKAVVLGRPAACQAALRASNFDLAQDGMLHVAPMTGLKNSEFGRHDGVRSEIKDVADRSQ